MYFKKKVKRYFNKKNLKKLPKNKGFRVAICSLILASMGIGYFSTGAKAAVSITNKGQGMSYVSIGGKNVYTYYKYLNDETKAIAYCLEHNKPQPSGQTFEESTDPTKAGLDSTKMNRAFTVLKYGHGSDNAIPEIRGLGTVDEKYYATQLAVWDVIGQVSMRDLQWKKGSDGVRNAYMALRDKSYNNTEWTGATISVTPANAAATKYGDGYISPTYQVTSTGTLESTRIGWSVSPSVSGSDGIKAVDESGNEIDRTNLKFGQKFKLVIPKKLEGKKISIGGSGIVQLKTILFYYTDANVQNVASYKPIKTEDVARKNATLTIPTDDTPVPPPTPPTEEEPMGRIKIKKIDVDTGERLQGAVFQVRERDTDVVVVDSLTTNSSGEAITGFLPLKDYVVRELNQPTNYVPNNKDYEVKLQRENEIVEVTVDNRIIKGKVEVRKTDSEIHDLFIKGATFAIYDERGTEVDRFTTDQNGHGISQDLRFGSYTMREIIPPEGYLPNNKTYSFNITRDGDVLTYNITNDIKKGNIQIVKIDTEHEERPVEGAVFGVYRKSDNALLEKVTTDRNGFAYTMDLRYGDYYLKELETPDGFWQSDKKYYINIREHNKTVIRYISNKPVEAKLKLVKFDFDTKEPLVGVKFKIWDKVKEEYVVFKYQENGQVVKRSVLETNGEGIAITPTILQDGDYRLEEVEAPEGYNKIKPIDFQINENIDLEDIDTIGLVHTVEVPNHRIYGSMELIKEGEGEMLRGAKFALFNQEGKKVSEHVTDGDGKLRIEHLTYGRHYLQEIEAPQGYVLDGRKIEFDIIEQDTLVTVKAFNIKIRGKIKIIKVDETGKYGLEGAEFDIKDSNGKVVDSVVTGNDGSALTRELEYGNYSIVETKAPEGHLISDAVYTASIKEDNTIVEVVADNSKVRGQIEVLKVSKDGNIPLEGAVFEIYNKKGQAVGTIETNRDGIALSKNLEYGDYTVREIKAPTGYVTGNGTYPLRITAHGQVVKVKVENDKIYGKIKVIKLAEDGKTGLSGAVFEIRDESGKVVDTVTTKDGGFALSKDLPYGNYYVKEIKAPEGHIISDKTYTVSIKEDGSIVEIGANNTKMRGQLEVYKTSSSSKVALEGAVFEIFDKDGKPVEKITTGKDGKALSGNLEYGKYTVKEVKAPIGYVLSDKVYGFEIKSQNQVITLNAENDIIKGNLEILKIDGQSEKTLKDAEFEIKDANGKVVDKLTTDDKGRTISVFLPYGKYTVKETKAPIGYLLPNKGYSFEIKNNLETIKLKAENQVITGTVEFTKKDLTSDEAVPGAKIQITNKETKEVVFEGITDKEGKIEVKLPYGKYIIKETVAPQGYVLNEAIGEFEIKENGEIVKAEIKNKKIIGRLDFVKVAEDEKTPLEKAKIQISNKETGKVIYEGVTGKEGKLIVNLPFGKYVIKEIEAPKGYALNTKPIEFEIKEDGQVVNVKMINKKETKKPEKDTPKENPKDTPKDKPSSGSSNGKLPQTGSVLGTSALIGIGLTLIGLGGYTFKKKKRAK